MPIYEYRCVSCGHTLDALQKISDEPLKDCPECDATALKRLISAPAFRLKGGGWYETDFKSDKDRRRNLADGGESKSNGEGAAASDKTSEAKSADAKSANAKSADAKSTDSKKSETPKSAGDKKASKGTGSEAA